MHVSKKYRVFIAAVFVISLLALASSQQQSPKKLRVSQGVLEGSILHKVDPQYPQEAKDNRVQGDVVLRILIDEQGNVIEAKPMSGPPSLTDAAVDAMMQWKFKPYLLNGEPVQVESVFTIRFRL